MRSILRHAIIALISFSLYGCNPSLDQSPKCEIDEGLPESFRNTSLPWPTEIFFSHSVGLSGKLVFPPSSRSLYGLSYWLRDSEPLLYTMHVERAPTSELSGELWTTLLVDGVQVHANFDGVLGTTGLIHLEQEGGARLEVEVPFEQLGTGIQLASILTWSPGTELAIGHHFSLVRNEVSLPPSWPAVNSDRIRREFRPAKRIDAPEYPLRGESPPGPNGAFVAEVVVGSHQEFDDRECMETEQEFLLVALLDGKQVPVGLFGERARVLAAWSEFAVLRIEFEGLPVDGGWHQLQVWSLPGFRRFLETKDGGPSHWHESPRPLINVWWSTEE